MIKMLSGITTNEQLNELARRMSIKYVPYFRGIFIRNTSDTDARRNESGLMNLDDATESGTHWVTYAKRNNRVVYFDSFDNLRLPKELVRYFEKDRVWYNRTSYQTYDQSFCGQMCLRFLQTIDAREFKKLNEVVWNLNIRTLFHVVDASTEREELTHPRGELFSCQIWVTEIKSSVWRFLRLITRYWMWTNRTTNFISPRTTRKLQFPRVRTKCET